MIEKEEALSLKMGPLAPKLKDQLKEQGFVLSPQEERAFQKAIDARNLLSVGLLTERQRDSISRKLLKKIASKVRRRS